MDAGERLISHEVACDDALTTESSPSRRGVVNVVVVVVRLLSFVDRLLFLAAYLSVSYRRNLVLKIRRLSWPCEESKKKRLCFRFVMRHARQSF